MIPSRGLRNGALVLAVLLAGPAACGGGSQQEAAARAAEAAGAACVSADTSPVSLAVRDYVTTASPLPQRYLSAYGTDSAVPEDGFKTLQATGPTYFWNDDPKAQAKVKARLADVGPYATMLVVYRGKTEADHGARVTVKLGGHYVGGDHDGKTAVERAIEVRCDSTRWRLVAPTRAPAPPAPVTPQPARP